MEIALSFGIGVASSVLAAWLLLLRQRTRLRLRFSGVVGLILNLVDQLDKDGFHPDYIVTVDRNSGVVGSILAGHLGLRSVVSVSTVNSRLVDGSRTVRLDEHSLSALAPLKGADVLVLICCNDSGTSLGCVVNYLRLTVHPHELRCAALYTTPSPAIMPQYHAVIVGKDTKTSMNRIVSRLPWMTNRWVHVLRSERLQ